MLCKLVSNLANKKYVIHVIMLKYIYIIIHYIIFHIWIDFSNRLDVC